MWQALKDQCRNQAPCDVVAIPHNGNIGLGGSYTTDGHSAQQLELRAQFEKLVEIHQHKGSSECYPGRCTATSRATSKLRYPFQSATIYA